MRLYFFRTGFGLFVWITKDWFGTCFKKTKKRQLGKMGLAQTSPSEWDLPKPVLFFVKKRIRKSFFTAGENSSKRIIHILFTDFFFFKKILYNSLQHKFVKKKEFQKIFFLQNRSVKNFAHPWLRLNFLKNVVHVKVK